MPTEVVLDPELPAQAGGKTVIVTGAAGGIGAATAALYNRHGANVVIADLPRSRPAAEALIKSLPHPDCLLFVPVDILDWAEMKDLFRRAEARFGSIDIVVANAAIMESSTTLDLDTVDEDGELRESREAFKVIDVNIKGTLNTLRLALHHMRSRGSGTIVLLLSTSAYFGSSGVAAYVSSKHAVLGLLRASQATATKHNIRVNAVAPFFTPTHMTSSFAMQGQKAGIGANTPEGVARAVVQASLQEGSGKCILACGGLLRELEGPRADFVSDWVGGDVYSIMAKAGQFFEDIGGYPLPKES